MALDGRLGTGLPIRLGSLSSGTTETYAHGQAQALIDSDTAQVFGQAQAWIIDSYETAIRSDFPAVWYRTRETSVLSAAANEITYGASGNGTYGSGVTLGTTGPITTGVSKAITLDAGANDYLQCGNTEYTTTFTLEFWAKATTTITAQTQASSGTAGLSGQHYIWFPVQ